MLQHLVYVQMIEMNWYIMESARVQLKLRCMREEKLWLVVKIVEKYKPSVGAKKVQSMTDL